MGCYYVATNIEGNVMECIAVLSALLMVSIGVNFLGAVVVAIK